MVGYVRIILESCPNRPPFKMTLHVVCVTLRSVTVRGRRNINFMMLDCHFFVAGAVFGDVER